jgi:hypothetical protein
MRRKAVEDVVAVSKRLFVVTGPMRTAILDDYQNVPSQGGAGTESWGKK